MATNNLKHTIDPGSFRVLVTASVVSSLIMLDSNIVAVSLPAIARSLGATFTDIEWVVSAYILTFSALLLAAGSFADLHGRKFTTLIGLTIFTTASVLCGLATSSLMLNLARALQGIGASMLLTASMAVISHAFSGPARAKAYAFWGACLGIAITSGPIVGGLMTDFFGWRWAFLINLPIGVILFVATAFVFKESRDPDAKRLDMAGIATFSGSLFLLVWALIDGNSVGWMTASIAWRLMAGAFLLGAFVLVEIRQERPMVDLTLFKQPHFLGTAVAMLGYAGGAQVMIFYLPLFLQNHYGLTPSMAGLAMIPFALPMFLTPRLGADLSRRYSSRALLSIGLATTFLGDFGLYVFTRSALPYPVFTVGMIVLGIGAGLLNSETSKAMQSAVPLQRSGMGSGLTSTTRFAGLLLAVAGLGATLSMTVSRQFVAAVTALGLDPHVATAVAKRVASGDLGSTVANLPAALQPHVLAAASSAFISGFAAASLAAAIVAAFSGVLAFLLVRTATEASLLQSGEGAPLAAVIE